jgi:site-specific DNA-methyltransferase (adenine-specific)
MSGIATEDDDMTKDAAAMSAPSAGSLPLDQIICGDNCEVMRQMPSESIDLVVTSPPYDDLRTYGGHSWDFYGVAWNLKRLLKPGGVIVWVVADATKDGSETLSSMAQAIHFRSIGLNVHDTMVYQKANYAPYYPGTHRYAGVWEYAFVLSSGKPKSFNPIQWPKAASTFARYGSPTSYIRRDGSRKKKIVDASHRQTKDAHNVWVYATGNEKNGHPAPYPSLLARDHILSWSNPGDVVLDPFSGSGTTAKMARETGRRFIGIEVNPEYVEISRKRLAQQALPMDVA